MEKALSVGADSTSLGTIVLQTVCKLYCRLDIGRTSVYTRQTYVCSAIVMVLESGTSNNTWHQEMPS